jgi:mono/diheme cytochrome c family protein
LASVDDDDTPSHPAHFRPSQARGPQAMSNHSWTYIAGGLSAAALILAGALASAAATSSASTSSAAPAPSGTRTPSAAPKAQLAPVSQGEYVARAADCISCHSPSPDKPFAGGYPVKSPFGIIYGPNITSDPDTGIGTWTQADFERALRQGVRKDGAYLYPAMPYDAYTKMSEADMTALWQYIHALKPVRNQVPKNTLPFPFSVRSGLAVWQSVYFKPGPFVAVPTKSEAWNRGAYLVEALGHCADCHTPRNIAMGPKTNRELAGANIQGWYAPDISGDDLSNLARWNTEQLATFFRTGKAPDNAKALGPMQEVIDDSLRYLSAGDLRAMALYLKDQPANRGPEAPAKDYLPRLAQGKLVYENNCSSCHQSDGQGIKGTVPALAGNGAVTAAQPYDVIMAVLEGFPAQGSWGAMGSFADKLSDDQISDVTNYVRTAWDNHAQPNAAPWSVGNWRKNATAAPGTANAMLCPDLAQDVLAPALKDDPASLKQAAREPARMSGLVASYRSARPKSSKAEVIEGLSTAYCRVLASESVSQARMSLQIADFAQSAASQLTANAKRP